MNLAFFRKNMKVVLTLAFFAGGVLVLGLRSSSLSSSPSLVPLKRNPVHFDVASVIAQSQGGKEFMPLVETVDLVTLFVIDAGVCAPCLLEAEQYAELLREFAGTKQRLISLALVVDEDSSEVARFLKIADLKIPTLYTPSLDLFKDNLPTGIATRHLYVVDPAKRSVSFEIPLPNSSLTPIDQKQIVVEEILRR